jgi:hypothetical protein
MKQAKLKTQLISLLGNKRSPPKMKTYSFLGFFWFFVGFFGERRGSIGA